MTETIKSQDIILKIQNLSVLYSGKKVLKNVNLLVPKSGVTALMGPSGCGKSTMLRSINRLHDLYSNTQVEGNIFLNRPEERIDLLNTNKPVEWVRSKVGMVFQKPNPFPKSIFENVAYGLRVQTDFNKQQIKERVEECLKNAGLWDEVHDRLGSPAQALSGGQQQRLCIARALAPSPSILLMDEPTSALDPIATKVIEELIQKLSEHTSIVLVTHSMQQAKRISNQAVFLYLGDIIECGETQQVFKSPQHDLTRSYIEGSFG